MGNKAKIAIVPCGHYVYFEQFNGLREILVEKASTLKMYFDDSSDVYVSNYVDRVDTAFEVVQEIKKEDVDALFILLTTYTPSAVVAPFAFYMDVPQILIAMQPLECLDYEKCTTFMQLVNDDICAMPEITGVYSRLGRDIPPCIVVSSTQIEKIKRQLSIWQKAINAKAAFKYSIFGYLGHTYEGMYDMHTDPTSFTRTFGAHVKMLEMCELVAYTEKVTESEISKKIAHIKRIFEIKDPSVDPLTDFVYEDDLNLSAKVAIALERLVQNNRLTALAYYYKGESNNQYEKISAAMIIGNTLLTSSGIPLAGEADLKTAAAMLIMAKLGGGGSFAELHPFDIYDNCVLVGHDGPHNIYISEGKPILRKLSKYHGKSGSGIGVEFSLRTGPVTLLSINVDSKGHFYMIAASGVSEAGRIPQTGNTNTRVTFNMPVTQFIEHWCEAGPTHHLALGVGNLLPEINAFARLMKIDLKIID